MKYIAIIIYTYASSVAMYVPLVMIIKELLYIRILYMCSIQGHLYRRNISQVANKYVLHSLGIKFRDSTKCICTVDLQTKKM